MKIFRNVIMISLLLLSFCFQSCAAIEGIFKAGVWVGILLVAGVLFLIIFLFSRRK
jgi:hypothetical protein